MELFKESFTLYVESGMGKKMEADIDLLGNQDGQLVTEKFKAKFYEIVIENYLCKFHCFNLTLLTTFLHLNTAHPGDQAFQVELKQKKGKKFIWQWLKGLMQKVFRR